MLNLEVFEKSSIPIYIVRYTIEENHKVDDVNLVINNVKNHVEFISMYKDVISQKLYHHISVLSLISRKFSHTNM